MTSELACYCCLAAAVFLGGGRRRPSARKLLRVSRLARDTWNRCLADGQPCNVHDLLVRTPWLQAKIRLQLIVDCTARANTSLEIGTDHCPLRKLSAQQVISYVDAGRVVMWTTGRRQDPRLCGKVSDGSRRYCVLVAGQSKRTHSFESGAHLFDYILDDVMRCAPNAHLATLSIFGM